MTAVKFAAGVVVCLVAMGFSGWLLQIRLLAEGKDADVVRGSVRRFWLGGIVVLALLAGAGAFTDFDIRKLTSRTAVPVIGALVAALAVAFVVRQRVLRMLKGPSEQG